MKCEFYCANVKCTHTHTHTHRAEYRKDHVLKLEDKININSPQINLEIYQNLVKSQWELFLEREEEIDNNSKVYP